MQGWADNYDDMIQHSYHALVSRLVYVVGKLSILIPEMHSSRLFLVNLNLYRRLALRVGGGRCKELKGCLGKYKGFVTASALLPFRCYYWYL